MNTEPEETNPEEEVIFTCRCECDDYACKRTFPMTINAHNEASEKGWVRHVACLNGGGFELERCEGFAIWKSS